MMRKLIVSIIAIAGILVACHRINNNIIAGTYTSHAESSFSIADDTLIIDKAASENIYAVTRKTGYRRIVSAKPDSLRHLQKRWTATWYEQQQQLVILQTGSIFTFPPDGKSLLYGSSEYRKR